MHFKAMKQRKAHLNCKCISGPSVGWRVTFILLLSLTLVNLVCYSVEHSANYFQYVSKLLRHEKARKENTKHHLNPG